MRAGNLRHRVRIEQPVDVRDTGGGFSRTWELLDVVPASIESEDSGEPLDADALTSTQRHLVSMRYRTGITPSMRVVHDSRTFKILSVVNVDQRNRELVLSCVEKVDRGAA